MKINLAILPVILLIPLFLFNCKTERPSGAGKVDIKSEAVNHPSTLPVLSNPILEDNLRTSAMEGNLASVEYLFSKNINVNATDPDGRTALMLAAFNGHTAIVKAFLDRGSPVNTIDSAGRTALIYAATGPNAETVKLLLGNGANPDIADSEEKFTALMFAASEGHLEVVKVLLDNKADPLLKDKDNDTAESFARKNGHVAVADLLHKFLR